MGMEERAAEEVSWAWIWRRRETKWEDSCSAASGERRGAQRLSQPFVLAYDLFIIGKVEMRVGMRIGKHTICSS